MTETDGADLADDVSGRVDDERRTGDDGSVIRTFPLSWGSQTCAAISHGC